MNAAARELRHFNVFYGHVAQMRLSKPFCLHTLLLVSLLLSALAVVYTTNLQRMTLSRLAFAQHTSHELALQEGQLILERASLVTPSRVQKRAYEKLNMVLPTEQQTFLLRAQ